MTNLEKSEIVISKVLALLQEWGIQQCDLRFEELELEREFHAFFLPCVDWLQAEGIIRSQNITRTLDGGGFVLNPTITAYGFALLDKNIQIGSGENRKISDAVKEVSRQKRSFSEAGDFVGGLLGGLTKSLGS